MNISEKVAYLKGLAEGLDIGADPKNGRIINGILGVLEEMAYALRNMPGESEKLKEKPKAAYKGYKEYKEKEEADNEYLDGFFEMVCPSCKKQVFIQTDDILESDDMSIECPECGNEIDIIDEVEEANGNHREKCPGCAGRFKAEDDEIPAF